MLVDDALADQQAIGKIDGVKGCFRNAGQMQIIFGTGVVNKVYAAFIQAAGISESSKSEAADLAAKKLNPFQRIARLLSNIFVPIIPAIVASGLLMGLLGMVKTYGWVDPSNALYIMLDMCSSAAFIILPILIGFTAAREFGGNPYLGATLGGILTHPALTNAWRRRRRLPHHEFLRHRSGDDRLPGHRLPGAAGGVVYEHGREAAAPRDP